MGKSEVFIEYEADHHIKNKAGIILSDVNLNP